MFLLHIVLHTHEVGEDVIILTNGLFPLQQCAAANALRDRGHMQEGDDCWMACCNGTLITTCTR